MLDNESKLNTLENTDTETISASIFVFVDSVSALQDAGSYAISLQNNLELHLGCHTCWLSYFTLLCLWCGRTVARAVAVLSAAFDTVRHDTLLNRLKSRFGVDGKALEWFASYPADRTQRVTVNDALSSAFPLRQGVSQGSCLGPLLFTVYTSKLYDIVSKHLPSVHCYADDKMLVWLHTWLEELDDWRPTDVKRW